MTRFRALAVTGTFLALIAVTSPPPVAAAPQLADLPEGSAPIQLGAAQGPVPGLTKVQAIQALENEAGRQLAVVRVYDLWNSTFPDSTTAWLKSTGHTLFLSIKSKRSNGTSVRWADIAAAAPGDPLYEDMVRWARAIKAYEMPMYLAFNHEPETSVSHPSGTPEAYVLAARAFVNVFRSEGVTNVKFALTSAIRNFSVSHSSYKYAPRYFAGEAWVDVLAVDAYNMYCRRKNGTFASPWRSLEQLLAPFMQFAAEHPTLELAVAEFGTPEDPAQSGRKAEWIDQARLLFQQPDYARFRAVSYWNELSHNYEGCDFRVTSSQSARDAFAAMGNDPYFSAS